MDEHKDQRPGIILTSDKKLEDGKEKKKLLMPFLSLPPQLSDLPAHIASQTPTQPQRWIIEKPHLLEGTTCQCQM